MEADLLLSHSEAPLLETPSVGDAPAATLATTTTTANAAVVDEDAATAAASGEEDASGYLSFTPLSAETQLQFLKLVIQLRNLKFRSTVEVKNTSDGGAASSSSSTGGTAEVWDVTTGPKLADSLRRKVFKEVTGSGAAGNTSDNELVEACVKDWLRAFGKKLARLDGSVVGVAGAAGGKNKKHRNDEDEEGGKKKEKKSKKDKKKDKKKEKKQKRSKFVDDMAGESDDESDY